MSDAALFALVLENNRLLKALTERMAPKECPTLYCVLTAGHPDHHCGKNGLEFAVHPKPLTESDMAHVLKTGEVPELDLKLGGAAHALVDKTRNDIRDSALEEAAHLFEGFARDAMEKATEITRHLARDKMLAHARSIRALKSKPAPQPSGISGELPIHDFGWALTQMRAGKKVRRPSWEPQQSVTFEFLSLGLLLAQDQLATDWEVVE